ncbi:MAG: hypothetical protein J6Q86_04315, partial [Methanobrevibacter sp.]|nr:hypothetical protein [Methanobrevibacter sp.]
PKGDVIELPEGSIPYTKKIFCDVLKRPTIVSDISKIGMMYLTKNCRDFSGEKVQKVFEQAGFEKLIVVTPTPEEYQGLRDSIVPMRPPVSDLFSLFETYIYTPVPRKFDCSPRLVAECSLFRKNILYWGIDYDDLGLQTRIRDIQTGDVWLKDNDEIIRILENSQGSRDSIKRTFPWK